MKKLFLIFFMVIFFSLAIFTSVSADAQLCTDPAPQKGLVPCGITPKLGGPDGKTVIGLVCPCEIGHFFVMLIEIYRFIVFYIATPLAVVALTIGGIFMLISAGNPNLFATGKKILYVAIIGLVLVWCSYLIIDFILKTIGFAGNWANPF